MYDRKYSLNFASRLIFHLYCMLLNAVNHALLVWKNTVSFIKKYSLSFTNPVVYIAFNYPILDVTQVKMQ